MSFLESERLSFRSPVQEDADRLCLLHNDASVRRYLDHRVFPMPIDGEREWIKKVSEEQPPRKNQVFVVSLKSGSQIIGATGLHDIHWIARSAEWGVMIDKAEWGQGYGREMARRMLRWAFDDLGLMRVGLRVHADHAAAIKCYEGAGFVREGRLRSAFYAAGQHGDSLVMSAVRDEWLAWDKSKPSKKKKR